MLNFQARKNLSVLILVACILASVSFTPKNVAAKELLETTSQSYLTVSNILTFQQLRGNPAWYQNDRNEFASSIWQFYGDGTFIFAPTLSSTNQNLYPILGTYRITGNSIVISGSRTFQQGFTSAQTVSIEGQLFVRNNQVVVAMTWVGATGMSANINDISFSDRSAKAYYVEATLQLNSTVGANSQQSRQGAIEEDAQKLFDDIADGAATPSLYLPFVVK